MSRQLTKAVEKRKSKLAAKKVQELSTRSLYTDRDFDESKLGRKNSACGSERGGTETFDGAPLASLKDTEKPSSPSAAPGIVIEDHNPLSPVREQESQRSLYAKGF